MRFCNCLLIYRESGMIHKKRNYSTTRSTNLKLINHIYTKYIYYSIIIPHKFTKLIDKINLYKKNISYLLILCILVFCCLVILAYTIFL